MATELNLYELLQVDRRASPEVIEVAYRRLAKKYHPDLNRSPDALDMMKKLNYAYQILGDPEKRLEYDRKLEFASVPNSAPRKTYKSNKSPLTRTESRSATSNLGCSIFAILGGLFLIYRISTFIPHPTPTPIVFAFPTARNNIIFPTLTPVVNLPTLRPLFTLEPNLTIRSTVTPQPTMTPFPKVLWVCVDLAYGRGEPNDFAKISFMMSQRDGWYLEPDGNKPRIENNWIAVKWNASPTGSSWVKLTDLCAERPNIVRSSTVTPTFSVEKFLCEQLGNCE